MRIGFIGAGRAGTSLALYLADFGFSCSGFYSRTKKHADEAAEKIGTIAFETADSLIEASDMVALSVSDDALRAVADAVRADVTGKYILHLSGAHTSESLDTLKMRGAFTASLHPAYTFAARLQKPDAVRFVAEGDREVLAQFEKRNIPLLQIEKQDKPLYHAAAVFASNYITALSHISAGILEKIGFPEEIARSLFEGLSHAAVHAAAKNGAENAITGPVARGDVTTIKAHLDALGQEETEIYKALACEILRFAAVPNQELIKELIQ